MKIVARDLVRIHSPQVRHNAVTILKSTPVNALSFSRIIAFPRSAIGYLVNAIATWYLFSRAITIARLDGPGIIVLGLFIVARS